MLLNSLSTCGIVFEINIYSFRICGSEVLWSGICRSDYCCSRLCGPRYYGGLGTVTRLCRPRIHRLRFVDFLDCYVQFSYLVFNGLRSQSVP